VDNTTDEISSSVSSKISAEHFSDDSDVSTVISARGTEEGLIIRIDGKAEWEEVIREIDVFLGGRKRFFEGGEVAIEWVERLPTREQSQFLESYLKENFGIGIVQRKRRLQKLLGSTRAMQNPGDHVRPGAESVNSNVQGDLFEGTSGANSALEDGYTSGSPAIDSLLERVEKLAQGEEYEGLAREGALAFAADAPFQGGAYTEKVSQYLGADLLFDEEANSRIIFGTLRSGQRIETPFSLVVIGDVNPGADIIAGGDVIVMGSLRGTAHAGAYEDDTLDRVVIALHMQPMQLRIGSVVSRGGSEVGKGPEVARIDNRMIVVEPYSARSLAVRRAR
jgi:septum formation inhibitor MinC